MCLSELKPGEYGRVAGLGPGGAVRQRMMDLGILPGAVLRLERVAPAGDPLWIRLRGYHVTLRRSEAATIELDGLVDGAAAGVAAPVAAGVAVG